MRSTKFPYPIRRLITKIRYFSEQLRYQLNRYNMRTQLRTRVAHGQLPTVRHHPVRNAAGQRSLLKKRFTAAEVKAYLQGQSQSNSDRIRTIAAQFQIGPLTALLKRPIPRRFNGRERLFERLTLITIRYAQRTSTTELAESLSCFYTVEDIEEAIDYVTSLVAANINRTQFLWL
jgi:hypothetical protein